MTYSGQLLLRKIERTLDSKKYCDLLIEDICPALKSEIESFILQQDNDPCHKSKYIMTAMTSSGREFIN